VGILCYDEAHHHAMIFVELDKLLPVCRHMGMGMVKACCLPQPGRPAPYLISDIQLCLTKSKRLKVGYLWTTDNAVGDVAYQVRFDVAEVLRKWGLVGLHCHEENRKDATEQARAGSAAPGSAGSAFDSERRIG